MKVDNRVVLTPIKWKSFFTFTPPRDLALLFYLRENWERLNLHLFFNNFRSKSILQYPEGKENKDMYETKLQFGVGMRQVS